jgi:general secretion pathway protein B
MSYILEALRKAEKQREIGQVPDIGSTHETPTHSRPQRWPWALAVILILNAVIIGALFWPAEEPEPPAVKTSAAPPGPATRPRDISPTGAIEHEPAPAPVPVIRQPDSPPPSAVAHEPAPAPGPELKTVQSTTDVHSPRPSTEKTSTGEKALKPLPLPKVPLQASQPAGPEKRAADSLTSPGNRPSVASKREKLPVWPLVEDDLYRQINAELKVKVHVYNKKPEKRFVYLNRTLYHEGDQLLEGPQLEEITQDGVILSFRGERFRVPAR